MTKRRWIDSSEVCPTCGLEDVTALTGSNNPEHLFEGDTVVCLSCGAEGYVSSFGDGEHEIEWEDQ